MPASHESHSQCQPSIRPRTGPDCEPAPPGCPGPSVLDRRGFLHGALCAIAAPLVVRASRVRASEAVPPVPPAPNGISLVDYHVHLDGSTIDKVLELSKSRGVKFGIVEHAGTKENKYPIVLSSDAELKAYLAMLEGKPVYKGVQAEWLDWMGCFSLELLAKLDFILTDTMTFPGKGGERVKLWEKAEIGDPEVFMDRYVDWHVEILSKEPVDLLANVSWLPQPLSSDYDKYWTEKRIRKVIDTAVKHQVAIEISSSFKLPKLRFLKTVKEAGLKFALGSNGRYPNMGKLEYSLDMARELGLTPADMFTPAPAGKKAVERRKALVPRSNRAAGSARD